MSRFTKYHWLALGEQLLEESGPSALTLDGLTKASGRTRGSFYHHFKSREDFLTAMMNDWRLKVIDETMERMTRDASPAALKALLEDDLFGLDTAMERHVRQLAISEPVVATALQALDDARMSALASILKIIQPKLDDPKGLAMAQFAAMIGALWLKSDDAVRTNAIQAATHRYLHVGRA